MKSERSTRFLSVKEYNRLMMRRAIYLSGPLTRTSLAEQLGLSLPTITTSVALMLEEGLLMEEPYDYKGRPYGRPAQQIDFLPQARLEIGIELDNKMMRGCMCDLRGGILKRWDSEAMPEAYDELLARLVEKIREFSAQIPAEQLIGIGIALPDCYAGSQTDQNGHEWNTAMLTEDISAQVGMPVWSGNSVRMRAFGRAMFGRSAPLITFAYLYVSNHIICPIGNNHRFMAAGRVTTGKIGHNIIWDDNPTCSSAENENFWETVIGEKALCKRAAQLIREGKATILAVLLKDAQHPHMDELLEARRQGDPDIIALLNSAVKTLALTASNIVNLLELELLTVDAKLFSIPQHQELFVKQVKDHLFNPHAKVQIDFAPADPMLSALGAAAYVVRESFLNWESSIPIT